MRILGPCIETHLTAEQAARRGGDMGQNIRDVFGHLGGAPQPIAGRVQREVWNGVLGQLAQDLDELCGDIDECGMGDCPAVVVEDQSKAFERIGVDWLLNVLAGWCLPTWIMQSFFVPW